jgi:hypothetical protein
MMVAVSSSPSPTRNSRTSSDDSLCAIGVAFEDEVHQLLSFHLLAPSPFVLARFQPLGLLAF